jgi:hypothetical protein
VVRCTVRCGAVRCDAVRCGAEAGVPVGVRRSSLPRLWSLIAGLTGSSDVQGDPRQKEEDQGERGRAWTRGTGRLLG